MVKGKVIIGNGGAEFGVRGYVSAYDAETGKLAWRFYTVPGDPSKRLRSADRSRRPRQDLERRVVEARRRRHGVGFDRLRPGARPAVHRHRQRLAVESAVPQPGGGDNLFLSSIVALKPDTGEYVWHYQTTPGETWDFTATQHIMLADLKIDGSRARCSCRRRRTASSTCSIATTGELISAQAVRRRELGDGDRPEDRPAGREPGGALHESRQPALVDAGPGGAHNWQPMAFSPQTGLVYLPAQELGMAYVHDPKFKDRARLEHRRRRDGSDDAGRPADRAARCHRDKARSSRGIR